MRLFSLKWDYLLVVMWGWQFTGVELSRRRFLSASSYICEHSFIKKATTATIAVLATKIKHVVSRGKCSSMRYTAQELFALLISSLGRKNHFFFYRELFSFLFIFSKKCLILCSKRWGKWTMSNVKLDPKIISISSE